jgi:hypothetical protein
MVYIYYPSLDFIFVFTAVFFQVPYSSHKEQSTAIFLNLQLFTIILIMETRMYFLLYFVKYSRRNVFMIVGFRRDVP